MKPPPALPHEAERLAALEQTGQLYSPAEERFDRITRLAAGVVDAPIALVSLVGESTQFFKSVQGLEAFDTPREVSFCAHALADGERLVIEDATRDERFADNPLVTGEPHVRAYAGRVIRAPSGEPVGTLCVIDSKPRAFTEEQLARLEDLKAIAEAELRRPAPGVQEELLREAGAAERARRLDPATHCWNHDAMVELLLRQAQHGDERDEAFAIALVQVERLGQVSGSIGEEGRNQVLRETASCLRRALAESEAVGRFDADAFLVLLAAAGRDAAVAAAERMRRLVTSRPFQAGRLSLWLDATVALCLRPPHGSVAEVVEAAQKSLAQARRDGRSITVA